MLPASLRTLKLRDRASEDPERFGSHESLVECFKNTKATMITDLEALEDFCWRKVSGGLVEISPDDETSSDDEDMSSDEYEM